MTDTSTGYVAPPMPTGVQTVTSSQYIGGFAGNQQYPGQALPTLDELRANESGGYQAGDEWLPANQDERAIEDLQRRLYQAGLLNADDEITPGYYDDTTRSAFERLLEWSNGFRSDWLTTLDRLRTNPIPPEATPQQEFQPFVAQVSNPADIKAHIRDTLRTATGTGKISEAELAEIVAEFQGKQVASQRQQYDAYGSGMGNGPGGTVTAPPSIDSFAEETAQRKNPVGFRAHEYLDKFSAISDMLGGASAVSS